MNKELTLLPIDWAESEDQLRREQRAAEYLARCERARVEQEQRELQRWDKIYDCFMMGAAGAMTACVVIMALGLC